MTGSTAHGLKAAMARVEPGFVFAVPTRVGFAVGLLTHRVPKYGSFVWISEELFPELPNLEQAGAIEGWRWPIGYHVGSGVRQKLIVPIGEVPIPPQLQRMPRMRGSVPGRGWFEVEFPNGEWGPMAIKAPTSDYSLPIVAIVDHPALVRKIESGWMPVDNQRIDLGTLETVQTLSGRGAR